VTELRVRTRRHALLVAEADVPTPSPAEKDNEEAINLGGTRSLNDGRFRKS